MTKEQFKATCEEMFGHALCILANMRWLENWRDAGVLDPKLAFFMSESDRLYREWSEYLSSRGVGNSESR